MPDLRIQPLFSSDQVLNRARSVLGEPEENSVTRSRAISRPDGASGVGDLLGSNRSAFLGKLIDAQDALARCFSSATNYE